MKPRLSLALRAAALVTLTASVSGCNFLERMSEVGEQPRVSRIQDPTRAQGYQPVSLPMPTPSAPPRAGTNSLWRPGARAFFKDQRATDVGDLLTVAVNVNEMAQLYNNTVAQTKNSEYVGAPVGGASPNAAAGGLEASLPHVLAGASLSNLFNLGSNSNLNATGNVYRQEVVVVNLAAEVTQKLPNGNLVIFGKQEMRINGEMRELSIQGIVRPEDISSLNTITQDKIAEARITYGGRGTLSDIQQPRYGQQIFDLISPF